MEEEWRTRFNARKVKRSSIDVTRPPLIVLVKHTHAPVVLDYRERGLTSLIVKTAGGFGRTVFHSTDIFNGRTRVHMHTKDRPETEHSVREKRDDTETKPTEILHSTYGYSPRGDVRASIKRIVPNISIRSISKCLTDTDAAANEKSIKIN